MSGQCGQTGASLVRTVRSDRSKPCQDSAVSNADHWSLGADGTGDQFAVLVGRAGQVGTVSEGVEQLRPVHRLAQSVKVENSFGPFTGWHSQ